MQNEYWIDVTKIGGQHEEQLEIHSNKRRYRPLIMDTGNRSIFDERGIGEWKPGFPPNPESQSNFSELRTKV